MKSGYIPVKIGELQKFFAPLELSTKDPPNYKRATATVDGNVGISLEETDDGFFKATGVSSDSPFRDFIPIESKIIQINKRKPDRRALNRIHGQCMILFIPSERPIQPAGDVEPPPKGAITVSAKVKGNLGITLQTDPLQGCVVTRILDTSPFYYLIPVGSEILAINNQKPDVAAGNVLKGNVEITFRARQAKEAAGLPPPPPGMKKRPAPPPPSYSELFVKPKPKPVEKPKPKPKVWKTEELKLMFNAAKQGDMDALQGYIKAGAPVDCTPFGSQTPLYIAAFYGQLECLKYLILNGADLNKTEKDGFTPSHAAASEGNLECLQYLQRCGADLNFKTNGGQTCKKLAIRTKRTDIILFLETIDKTQSIYEEVGLDTMPYWNRFNEGETFMERDAIQEMVKDLLFHFRYEVTQKAIDERMGELLMYLDVEGVGKVHNATFRDSFSMYVAMCWFVNPGVLKKEEPPPLLSPNSTDELAMALQLSMESAEAEKKNRFQDEDDWEDVSTDLVTKCPSCDGTPDVFHESRFLKRSGKQQYVCDACGGNTPAWPVYLCTTCCTHYCQNCMHQDNIPENSPALNRELSFTVGQYKFDQNSYVRAGLATNSDIIRDIDVGDIVNVKSIKPVDGRIRGEIQEGGFVTLFNITKGKRYVTRVSEKRTPSPPAVRKQSMSANDSAGRIAAMEYEGMIQALNAVIDEKDQEIARLRAELNKVGADLKQTTKGLVSAKQQLEDKADCVICQDEPKDHVILPCGHLCICASCAKESGIKECPLCMKRFTQIKRVYM